MASLPTGSDELVYIQTDKLSVTIKGPASHPEFQGVEYRDGDSSLKVVCNDPFVCQLRENEATGAVINGTGGCVGDYVIAPMFYEQQRYEMIIEAAEGHKAEFWHDNLNIRNKVTRASRQHEILSGILNFGNEIGQSDLIVRLDGADYLRLEIEVFPTKISYKEDYQAIITDVTTEIYNLVFDFLKKTYQGYRQSEHVASSPVEFFAVIRKIYGDFIKSADMIMSQPHHMLETTHAILPGHKVKRVDNRGIRWIEKHPEYAVYKDGTVAAEKALAVKKQVTYDTKENRLTKYILISTAKKLDRFRRNYLRLQRQEDAEVTREIDSMIQGIRRRYSTSFLADVGAHETSAGLSLVFSMAPGYRDLYKYYLMLLHGLSITGDVFQISIKDLALLYEYWCFIKLNCMMKERYQLVSQDIIQAQGNGLYVSLVKGSASRVKYRNPSNGETITLSYNPKETETPTGTQRPDNVLMLEKKGAKVNYEYVFDAKYRINPALPGTDYYQTISHQPGPEVGDINTMHRYRDAIVYQSGASPYERKMFGAYVLFPYHDEAEYRSHKFFESIRKVNIGGLPFLPSATELVSSMLDELVSDSPESAFERATLPVGIEEKLAKVDWSKRDVLVGALSSASQLDICLQHRFYHIPCSRLKNSDLPIHTIALYQSHRLFGVKSGIRYYGEVIQSSIVPRNKINEIPKKSEELYYRFEVRSWKELPNPIAVKETGVSVQLLTHRFLLEHSQEVPELRLHSENEYRLYCELKRAINSTEINEENAEIGFHFGNSLVVFEEGNISVYKNGIITTKFSIESFTRSPTGVFRQLLVDLA